MYSGTSLLWTALECPDYRDVLISEWVLYTKATTKATFRTPQIVLIIEVSLFQTS